MTHDRQEAIAQFRRQRAQLLQECIALLEAIATRPGALKLLAGARDSLKLFAAYKVRRSRFGGDTRF